MKRMKMKDCKRRLAVLWYVSAAVPFVVILIQTVKDTYAGRAEDAWTWFLPTVMPTLSLITAVLVADALGKSQAVDEVDAFMFWLAVGFSVFYLVLVSTTLFLSPLARSRLGLLQMSHLWLAPVQGLTAGALGVFFLAPEKATAPGVGG